MRDWKETDFGKIPLHWELKRVVDIKSIDKRAVSMGPFGSNIKAENFVESGVPVIRGTNLNFNRYVGGDFVYLTNEKADELIGSNCKAGDLVFTHRGTIGQVALIPKDSFDRYVISQSGMKLSVNPEMMNNVFLFYFFKSEYGQYQILKYEAQVGVPSISNPLTSLKEMQVPVPPLPEQTAIAEVLSSLDDKIDLLHRQNKILEQLAETLFRQWFVEEVDEKWEVGKLGDIAVVQNGYAFSSRNYVPYQEGHLEVLKMGHIAVGGGLRTSPKKDFVPREEKFKKWTLNKNDIIMGMTDMKDNVVILGVPAMIDRSDKYVLNQRVARIYLESNNKLLNSYLLYVQLNNKEFIATLQSKANSGVQVNLSTEAIKECDIIIPPIELQKEKGNVIAELYMKKENNDIQIKSLTQLRDTLLPKLMSGEVRVIN